jgi:enediyne biosynthesis protein E4
MNIKHRKPRLLWGALMVLLAAVPTLFLCLQRGATVRTSRRLPEVRSEPQFFMEITAKSGIAHTYRNGEEAGQFTILESLGGGAGLIDFDGDGLLDVFLPGGGTFTGANMQTIAGRPCKMYKNLGNFKFQDVTKVVGLDKIDFYTHGVAVADYNCDGWPDLLVTGWGRLALFRNDPVDPQHPSKGRKFTEVTKEAGLNDQMWSTSAGWADFDGDGHADLYVCHYVNWSPNNNPPIGLDGRRDVDPPKNFDALPHILYRNNGDGTFTNVSKAAGLRVPRAEEDYGPLHKDYEDEARARLMGKVADAKLEAAAKQAADDTCNRLRDADAAKEYGKGLGVIIVDLNGDGKPDVWVTCDTVDKLLYVNRSKPGRILFEEMAVGAGVARDDIGRPNGSRGTDACDSGTDLRPALWCVNYENENHALYYNKGRDDELRFRFATQLAGISAIGQHWVGWGTGFADFDLDGLQDLFISNGHSSRFSTGKARRAQLPVLMHCVEEPVGRRRFKDVWRRFEDVTAINGGDYCARPHCGRGVAFGDLDNDGRVDMVLANLNEPVAVLKTVAGQGNHWIGFGLKRKDNRDPVGARVVLEANGKKQACFAKGGGSYASANDPRHVFGLGKTDKIDNVRVTWPDLTEQTWEGLAVDQYWVLSEGAKEAQPPQAAR